ncbi:MAG: YaiI/YqxD family protein [Pseudomonadota bacterium]
MQIWVDADACPVVIREILFKAARRTGVPLIFVANRALPLPKLSNVRMLQVEHGFDVADDKITSEVRKGDLVITSDIPLASDVIDRGATALSPRGELHTADTIKARLNMRDFMEDMRSTGAQIGGPAPFGQREKQAFANHLDRAIARVSRSQ